MAKRLQYAGHSSKPEPVVTAQACSVCGLAWDDHEEPTLEECVRLLKAALVTARTPIFMGGGTVTQPVPMPYWNASP